MSLSAQGMLRNLRSSKDVNLNDGAGGESPSQEKLTGTDSQDIEAGRPASQPRKRKTSQNVHSHGSFFLRVGAIGKSSCVHYITQISFYFTPPSSLSQVVIFLRPPPPTECDVAYF